MPMPNPAAFGNAWQAPAPMPAPFVPGQSTVNPPVQPGQHQSYLSQMPIAPPNFNTTAEFIPTEFVPTN